MKNFSSQDMLTVAGEKQTNKQTNFCFHFSFCSLKQITKVVMFEISNQVPYNMLKLPFLWILMLKWLIPVQIEWIMPS